MKISIKERVIKLIGYLALFPAFLLMMHLLDFSWPLPSHTYAEVHREKEKLEKLLKSTKAALEEEKQARKQAELKRNDAEDKRREIQGQLLQVQRNENRERDREKELQSKLRKIQYRIQTDFTATGGGQVTPDEITLNNQPIREDSLVKPFEYKLVIKKEGYEPVIETIVIEPDERPYLISKYMKSLPREVMFQITGDYDKDPITPDEVSLNGEFIKYGESVKPDAYRVVIRKRGYDPVDERIVIDPKSVPYILQKLLNSSPRRVEHYIIAKFPANMRLFPDTCTLNNRDFVGEQSFKPGEYALDIKRSGYKPIQKPTKIPPDEGPFIIKEIMDPKLRQVSLSIAQEIPHDDPNIQPTVTLVNEKTTEGIPLKNADVVDPGSYLLKVEMNGYEPEVSKELIMPSEEPYQIMKRLIASPRAVVTRIIAEFPADEQIIPDEITLNNKPIPKDFKVKPGTHDLVILKEGYVPLQKQIKIGANASEYLLYEKLCAKEMERYGLPEKIWNACNYNHNGQEILDMTTDAWCGLPVAEQQKYAAQYQEGYAKAKGLEVEKTIAKSGASFAFRLIPSGRFWRGSPDNEKGRNSDEKKYRVVISQPFYLGKTEVTQGQWQSVMGSNPSIFKNAGSNAPVESVSWDDCQGFFQRTGLQFPTEAQWEYACRSGVTRAYYWGDEMDGAYAWYGENSGRGKTQAVAQKTPNAWGLFDMSGNVWEWCSDGYMQYEGKDAVDPKGAPNGSYRVDPGGGWHDNASCVRCAYRGSGSPEDRYGYLGFRCALAPQKK